MVEDFKETVNELKDKGLPGERLTVVCEFKLDINHK
jgi:hypothetical protein